MWFEILPPLGIIFAAMAAPTFALYGINKLILGNPYRRGLEERFDRAMYQRDCRLSGNAYKMNGLDCIPDEQKKK